MYRLIIIKVWIFSLLCHEQYWASVDNYELFLNILQFLNAKN